MSVPTMLRFDLNRIDRIALGKHYIRTVNQGRGTEIRETKDAREKGSLTKAGERGRGAGGQNTRGPGGSEGPGKYCLSSLYVCPK